MKYLQILCEQADLQLTLKYYCPYLNILEESLLREAVQKKSALHAFNLLKALSLQILFLLQNSACLWGESHWQSLLTRSQCALTVRGTNEQLRRALRQADDVISTASVTETVRKKIWSEIKDHAVLSDSQAQRYESARKAYLTRQTSLNELESTVNATIREYHQLIEPISPLNQSIPLFRPPSPEFSHPLRCYDLKMVQARLSKENIHNQIQCEGDARLVYQNLTKELMQKPTAEKLAEEVQKAKEGLQRHVEHIAEKTDQYRRQILWQTQFSVEHRTQVTIAHANRIEQIALSISAIIHAVQSHCNNCCQPLLNLMREAESMKKNVHQQVDGQALREKLLAINTQRINYEKSITSCRAILFTNRSQLQKKQKLNRDLQTALSQLVIPISGFDDKNSMITYETIKKLKITSDKLNTYQGNLTLEQEKISHIQSILTV